MLRKREHWPKHVVSNLNCLGLLGIENNKSMILDHQGNGFGLFSNHQSCLQFSLPDFQLISDLFDLISNTAAQLHFENVTSLSQKICRHF